MLPFLLLLSAAASSADDKLTVRDGLELWLDARAIPIVERAPTETVAEWKDSSGRGRHLSQKDANARPRLLLTPEGPVVRFDGVDDYLARKETGLTTPEATVFVVAAMKPNLGAFPGLISFNAKDKNDYTSGLNIDLGPWPAPKLSMVNVEGAGFGGVANLRNRESPLGKFHLFELVVSADAVTLAMDGKPEGRRTRKNVPMSFDGVTLGARGFNNEGGLPNIRCFGRTDVAEAVVYSRALTADERKSTRDYLLSKHKKLLESAPTGDDSSEWLEPVKDAPPIQMLVPGFEVREVPLSLPNVNNILYRRDGSLVALGYNGDIWICRDTNGDGLPDKTVKYWDNQGRLRAPIGMDLTPPNYPHGNGVFVAAKGRISLIVDENGDDVSDKEVIAAGGWKEIYNNVDALGVAVDPKDGSVWYGRGSANFTNPFLIEKDGKPKYSLKDETGCVIRIAPDFKSREIIATGVRFTVAMRFNKLGDLFATDQEGATWLANGNPFDELLLIEKGRHYGFPPRHSKHLPNVIDEPSVFDYVPQHQSTCGLNFNEPVVPGGPTFGPKEWAGDAIVMGYSRGKLYRTKLVKSASGYVATNHLFACSTMLTVDACVTPDGGLLVACHSGGPDWGSGPAGKGKLFKISAKKTLPPQPLFAHMAGPQEVRIEFDRPVEPESVRDLVSRASLTFGPHVRAGDRFETLWPGYAVVQAQKTSLRKKVGIRTSQLTPDRRSLILSIDRVEGMGSFALTIPKPKDDAAGTVKQHAEIDLDFDQSGVEASWKSTDGKSTWSGWLPHLDLEVAKKLTARSATHDALWASMNAPGELTFNTILDLRNMLRPAVQPGSTIDDKLPSEAVELKIWFSGPTSSTTLNLPLSNGNQIQGTYKDSWLTIPSSPILFPAKIRWQIGGNNPVSTRVHWSTNEDARHRSLPLRRMITPWTETKSPSSAEPSTPKLPKEIIGGNWAKGRAEFFGDQAACFKCHTIHGQGGGIGPDLSNLIHRDYASVHRDVTQPSFALNPDHLTYAVVLKDGRTLTGVLRNAGSKLQVGDVKGAIVEVERSEIETVKASSVSTMPVDLLKPIGDARTRDLFTFLLAPPPSMPRDLAKGRPKPRPAAEVRKVLEGAPNPPEKTRPIRIVLTAGPKDHGPGEHDYPAWQKAWSGLLEAGKDVTVETAWEWPSKKQFETADAVVLFQHGDWNAKRALDVDAFLERGGGLVLIHWAVDGQKQGREFAKRIGLAGAGAVGFRHGKIDLDFKNPKHPILRNFERLTLVDETYWKMVGDLPDDRVLASAFEEGAPRPQLWSLERGKGRVFVSIPGHYSWSFDDPLFRVILLRSFAWVAKEPVDRFNDLVWPGADFTP
jgi:putative heme-binding domain-containing protein